MTLSRAGSIPASGTKQKLGVLAQLVERLFCTQEVSGSNPLSSTNYVFGCNYNFNF
jgi:hypothetical protein